jgi:hypothetical protein
MSAKIDYPGSPCWHCEGTDHDTAGHPHSARCAAPTQPPSQADQEIQAFETLIKKVGEGQARWTALLTLLEERAT